MAYVCSICGKEHKTVLERANCEISCSKELEAKAKIEKEKKLAAKKEARLKEVNDAYDQYKVLLNDFIKDYGFYERHNTWLF